MTFGDLLEVAAIACVVVAAFILFSVGGALVAAAFGLFYLAQGLSERDLPKPPRLRRSK
jgi:hypothetical protein